MPKLLPRVAALLIVALVGGPLVLERCLAGCAEAAAVSGTTMAGCHHMGQPARHDVHPATTCGHDHRASVAIATGQVNVAAPLAVAVLSPCSGLIRATLAGVLRAPGSPPARSAPPEFVRPLRV